MKYYIERFDPKEWTTREERRANGTGSAVEWRLYNEAGEWCQTFSTKREARAAVEALGGTLIQKGP